MDHRKSSSSNLGDLVKKMKKQYPYGKDERGEEPTLRSLFDNDELAQIDSMPSSNSGQPSVSFSSNMTSTPSSTHANESSLYAPMELNGGMPLEQNIVPSSSLFVDDSAMNSVESEAPTSRTSIPTFVPVLHSDSSTKTAKPAFTIDNLLADQVTEPISPQQDPPPLIEDSRPNGQTAPDILPEIEKVVPMDLNGMMQNHSMNNPQMDNVLLPPQSVVIPSAPVVAPQAPCMIPPPTEDNPAVSLVQFEPHFAVPQPPIVNQSTPIVDVEQMTQEPDTSSKLDEVINQVAKRVPDLLMLQLLEKQIKSRPSSVPPGKGTHHGQTNGTPRVYIPRTSQSAQSSSAAKGVSQEGLPMPTFTKKVNRKFKTNQKQSTLISTKPAMNGAANRSTSVPSTPYKANVRMNNKSFSSPQSNMTSPGEPIIQPATQFVTLTNGQTTTTAQYPAGTLISNNQSGLSLNDAQSIQSNLYASQRPNGLPNQTDATTTRNGRSQFTGFSRNLRLSEAENERIDREAKEAAERIIRLTQSIGAAKPRPKLTLEQLKKAGGKISKDNIQVRPITPTVSQVIRPPKGRNMVPNTSQHVQQINGIPNGMNQAPQTAIINQNVVSNPNIPSTSTIPSMIETKITTADLHTQLPPPAFVTASQAPNVVQKDNGSLVASIPSTPVPAPNKPPNEVMIPPVPVKPIMPPPSQPIRETSNLIINVPSTSAMVTNQTFVPKQDAQLKPPKSNTRIQVNGTFTIPKSLPEATSTVPRVIKTVPEESVANPSNPPVKQFKIDPNTGSYLPITSINLAQFTIPVISTSEEPSTSAVAQQMAVSNTLESVFKVPYLSEEYQRERNERWEAAKRAAEKRNNKCIIWSRTVTHPPLELFRELKKPETNHKIVEPPKPEPPPPVVVKPKPPPPQELEGFCVETIYLALRDEPLDDDYLRNRKSLRDLVQDKQNELNALAAANEVPVPTEVIATEPVVKVVEPMVEPVVEPKPAAPADIVQLPTPVNEVVKVNKEPEVDEEIRLVVEQAKKIDEIVKKKFHVFVPPSKPNSMARHSAAAKKKGRPKGNKKSKSHSGSDTESLSEEPEEDEEDYDDEDFDIAQAVREIDNVHNKARSSRKSRRSDSFSDSRDDQGPSTSEPRTTKRKSITESAEPAAKTRRSERLKHTSAKMDDFFYESAVTAHSEQIELPESPRDENVNMVDENQIRKTGKKMKRERSATPKPDSRRSSDVNVDSPPTDVAIPPNAKKTRFGIRMDYTRRVSNETIDTLLKRVLIPTAPERIPILDHFKYPIVRRAIVNRNTLCYAISMVQLLLRVPQVYSIIRGHIHRERITRQPECFLCMLGSLISERPSVDDDPAFVAILRSSWKNMESEAMHCVMEAMQHFFYRFDEEYMHDHPFYVGQVPTLCSPIRTFFEIDLISDYKCKECKYAWSMPDKHIYISVDLLRKSDGTMQSMVDNISNPGPVHGLGCRNCDRETLTCANRFIKLPEVLLYFVPRVRSKKREKDSTVVSVQKQLIVKDARAAHKYALCSFITHHGSSGHKGHYKSYEVDRSGEVQFNEFDDGKVIMNARIPTDINVVLAMFRKESAVAKDAQTDIILDGRGNVSFAHEKHCLQD